MEVDIKNPTVKQTHAALRAFRARSTVRVTTEIEGLDPIVEEHFLDSLDLVKYLHGPEPVPTLRLFIYPADTDEDEADEADAE